MGEVTEIDFRAGPPFRQPSPIERHHDVSKFFSGQEPLDDWLKRTAFKSEGRSARTYVVCQGNHDTVVAYYCIATGAVSHASAPRGIRRNMPDPIPVAIIGRLAVDQHFQGQRLGSGLLADALSRVAQISKTAGVRAVMVHAIDQRAMEFYRKFGFIEYPGNSKTLFLPIETVLKGL